MVTVDDEGPGIAEADLPHVFERFYRSTDSRAMPGSGLGLSIVAQVAERHAGSVEAGPAPTGGTRVTFRVPGAPSPKPAEPPAQAAAAVTARPRSSTSPLVEGYWPPALGSRQERSNGSRQACGAISWWMALGPHEPGA